MKKTSLLFGATLVAAGLFLAWFVPQAWLSKPAVDAPSLAITVPSGAVLKDVAKLLAEKGVIASEVGYRIYGFFDGAARRPRAGTYRVQNGMSARTLARLIALGPEREEIAVTVIEGWDIDDIEKAVEATGSSWKTPFVKDWVEDFSFLKSLPGSTTLEGYLFPDTYRVWRDQLPEGLIQKQLAAFGALAPRLLSEAQKQKRTLHDVVILASIVEKEVATAEDRKIVAGIFWNRLQIGMALQSDATLNYVTNAGRSRLNAEDLKSTSLYNTYKYRGLPPGPISNPGADALEAALFPADTEYQYFLTDAKGKTYFGKTLEEHIRNRQKAFGG